MRSFTNGWYIITSRTVTSWSSAMSSVLYIWAINIFTELETVEMWHPLIFLVSKTLFMYLLAQVMNNPLRHWFTSAHVGVDKFGQSNNLHVSDLMCCVNDPSCRCPWCCSEDIACCMLQLSFCGLLELDAVVKSIQYYSGFLEVSLWALLLYSCAESSHQTVFIYTEQSTFKPTIKADEYGSCW